MIFGENNIPANQPQQCTIHNDELPLPAPFSELKDPLKYNGSTVSKATIDQIVATDFQHCKAMQEAKMRGIKASVLKIDWHYKLAPKIKVYCGCGKSFSPYQTAVSIQNEDALTIFWKFYTGSESDDTMEDDLKQFKKDNSCWDQKLNYIC